MFNIIDFYFLIPLLSIGLITSYTDIKFGKIYNKTVVVGFVYIFSLLMALFFYSIATSNKENLSYILSIVINGLTAFLVGYLLWNLKLWSAGDAKLFSLYAFLVPLSFYSKSYFEYFPSLNLLANIFFPFLVALMIGAIITVGREILTRKINVDLEKVISSPFLTSVLLNLVKIFLTFSFTFLAIGYVLTLLNVFFQSEANTIFAFLIAFLAIRPIQSLMAKFTLVKWTVYSLVMVRFAAMYFFESPFRMLSTLKTILFFMLIMSAMRGALNFYIQEKEVRKIKLKEVKRGMIPLKENMNNIFKNVGKLIAEDFGSVDAGGLTEEQAATIRSLSKADVPEIKIYNTFPFAPFLLLSAIISILTKSSFIPLISGFFVYIMQ